MSQKLMPTAALALAYAFACASATPGALQAQAITQTPTSATLSKLERDRANKPNSAKVLRALGLAYHRLDRFADARTVLDQARQLDPKDGLAALYSGLSSEALKDFTAARTAYGKYLEVGKTKKVREQIRARLVAMAKDELKLQAAAAVANETALRGQQAPGTTVAVLPFQCTCSDTTLLPLGRGVAELVVADLARSASLRVLERDRMQAIADEIRLSQSTQVDAATATRAGKLIAAGRILNGQIIAPGGPTLNLTGATVNTNTSQVEGNPSQDGLMDAIFDTEKQFVLRVFESLGIVLTVAERREFDRRPTQNFQAFLNFSRGLVAEDAGRLDEAVRFFEAARAQDPGFGAALQRAQSAAQARTGQQVTSQTVTTGLQNSAEGAVVAAAQQGRATEVTLNATLNTVVGDVNPTMTNSAQNNTGGGNTTNNTGNNMPQERNAQSEATGTNQPATRTGQITIVITRPGTP